MESDILESKNKHVVHFPAPPQTGKPLVLLQKAVRLTVDVVITMLVIVEVPKDSKKRFGPFTLGTEKPDSISKGITKDSSLEVLANSTALGRQNL